MNNLNREFNGKIQTYSKLDMHPVYWNLNKLKHRFSYYFEVLSEHIKEKRVHVVPHHWVEGRWYEYPLVCWFLNHYEVYGFDKVVLEKTPEYYTLKKELGVDKFPDVLGYKNGEWLRVELECWEHKYLYQHGPGYADVVFSYDDYYNNYKPIIPSLTLKEYFGVENIISSGEIFHYLYLFNDEFKLEYSKQCTDEMTQSFGLSVPW